MRVLFLLLLFLVSCATRTPVTDKLTRKSEDIQHKIPDVPVITQKKNHCGPASLAMVLQYHGSVKTPDELATNLFYKDLGGSFRSDILASARREGMMAFEMDDLSDVIDEVKVNHPVIVFQNMGLESAPKWHFSVLRGVNLRGPDVYLNSGESKVQKVDMRFFERSWILGGRWAALILPPDKLSETRSAVEHVEAASLLEAAGNLKAALLAYETILKKWPGENLALIGASNVSYALEDKNRAEGYLLRAQNVSPGSAIVYHNLAIIQSERGRLSLAGKNARKALSLATPEQLPKFKAALQHLVPSMSQR